MVRFRWMVTVALLAVAAGVAAQPKAKSSDVPPAAVQRAMERISEAAMKAHVRFLSSDLLEGRGPGTRGDRLTQEYLAAQFAAAGLEPAGDDGTYFQKVS
ncbi:MAG TPA: peptidase M28, partial [Thermoanaerobaculia bacterium]|nr:peptidase M28 [Thermoanaerobaculia bacterium]